MNSFKGKEKKFGSIVMLLERKRSFLLIPARSSAGKTLDDRQVFIAFYEESGDLLMYYKEQSHREVFSKETLTSVSWKY